MVSLTLPAHLMAAVQASLVAAYAVPGPKMSVNQSSSKSVPSPSALSELSPVSSRRAFANQVGALTLGTLTATSLTPGIGGPAQAIGPVKISLINPTYTAAPCPKDKPIPGEKAMKGMRGLCVQVSAKLENAPEKDLVKGKFQTLCHVKFPSKDLGIVCAPCKEKKGPRSGLGAGAAEKKKRKLPVAPKGGAKQGPKRQSARR